MSRFVDQATEALSRWRQMNEGEPVPPVKVVLNNGEEIFFNGLAVAPDLAGSETVALASSGYSLPILVVRDADIVRVQIGVPQSQSIGFNPD